MKIRSQMVPISMVAATILISFDALKGESVLSNLTRGQRGPDLMPGLFEMEGNQFTTGQTGPLLLNLVALSASIPVGSQLTVSIYGDNSGQIGANVLGTLVQQQPGHGPDNYTFAAPGIQLSADSAYWVTVSTLSGSTGGWYWTEDSTADSPYGWSIGSHAYFGSGSWHYFGFWPYSFALDATLVPEPHQLSIVGLGLLCVGLSKVKRMTKAHR